MKGDDIQHWFSFLERVEVLSDEKLVRVERLTCCI